MEVGCGGVGLRTSRGHVVNLYFWHMESEGGVTVRREDFLGRADSARVKRDLLRRMAEYDRQIEQRLVGQIAKLERSLGRLDWMGAPAVVVIEDRRRSRSRNAPAALFAGVRGI